MSSPAQITANQANAQLSTGPRTAQGKQRSAGNAFKHGLFSSIDRLTPHERERYDAYVLRYTRFFSPVSEEEESLVQEAALASFRADRCRLLEELYVEQRIKELREKEPDIPAQLTPHDYDLLRARILLIDPAGVKVYARLLKWEAAFQRTADKKLATLQMMYNYRRTMEAAAEIRVDPCPSVATNSYPAKTNPIDTPDLLIRL